MCSKKGVAFHINKPSLVFYKFELSYFCDNFLPPRLNYLAWTKHTSRVPFPDTPLDIRKSKYRSNSFHIIKHHGAYWKFTELVIYDRDMRYNNGETQSIFQTMESHLNMLLDYLKGVHVLITISASRLQSRTESVTFWPMHY